MKYSIDAIKKQWHKQLDMASRHFRATVSIMGPQMTCLDFAAWGNSQYCSDVKRETHGEACAACNRLNAERATTERKFTPATQAFVMELCCFTRMVSRQCTLCLASL